jgi:RNA polymerase sigma factor (sigma-70 family)
VQEASLKAWRRLGQFNDTGGGFRAWFLTIVANESRSLRRGRWWSVIRLPEIRPRLAGTDKAISASELRDSMSRLAHKDRVLLYLYYWLDLPLAEIGAVLGISSPAAKARLYRAVGRLRLELDPNEEKAL